MSAEQCLRDGDLRGALSQLKDQIRSDPARTDYRVFLFQLYAVTGDWGRALTQLDVAGELDAGTLAMVQTYRELLRCEAFREEVFAGHRSPMIFGDPEQWMALCIQALALAANEQYEKASQQREQAFETAPTTSGTIDGESFQWIADADSRIGPFLEAILNGAYYWVPFHRIERVLLEEPEDLRDLIWAPAQFVWSNGGQSVGFVPSRYPGSEASEDGQIQLARKTEWIQKGDEDFIGSGQRMLATDGGEYSLLNTREIVFDTTEESQGGA